MIIPSFRRAASSSTSAASPSISNSTNYSRARPFLYVLGVMPLVCLGLGGWQIQRLRWKLAMIDQLEAKLNKDTVRLPARIDPDAIPEYAYRKVYLTGTFDHDNEILLGPRTRDGQLGFHVITPLVRGEGQDTILVNRGFVTRVHREKPERPHSLGKEAVEIVGMLRDQDRSNSFTPVNNAEKNEWVFANIEEMAAHTGSEPVLVDEIFTGHAGEISMRLAKGTPVGRAAVIELRNQHMTYAVTWFALSIATSVMLFRLVKRPSRKMTAGEFRNVSS